MLSKGQLLHHFANKYLPCFWAHHFHMYSHEPVWFYIYWCSNQSGCTTRLITTLICSTSLVCVLGTHLQQLSGMPCYGRDRPMSVNSNEQTALFLVSLLIDFRFSTWFTQNPPMCYWFTQNEIWFTILNNFKIENKFRCLWLVSQIVSQSRSDRHWLVWDLLPKA